MCAGGFHRQSDQVCNLRACGVTPKSKGTLEYLSRRIPVDGHGKAMTLIIIFSVGKTDRSSNKDGAGYEQNRP